MRKAKRLSHFWIFLAVATISVACKAQQLPPVAVDCFGIGENYCDQVQANTYFVSNSGSDSNAGSQSAPWLTLNHAVHSIGPGATIVVENGVYDGFRNFSISGTADAPITLKAGGSNVIVSRGLNGNRDIFEINGVSHWVVDGFTVSNGSRSGIAVIDADSITLKNNDIGPNQVWGIFTGFSTNLDILHNRTFDSAEQHGIYVSNSRVTNDNIVVRGNMVYGNHQNGIQFNGDCEVGGDGVIGNSVIEANRIYDNGYKGLSLISMSNSRVSNNIIYENGVRGGAGGIHLTDQPGCGNPSRYNEVFNNTLYEPRIAAIRLTDAANNNTLFNNIAVSGTPVADEVGGNQIDSSSNLALGSASGLFVDFSARNFELADGSAALDAGRSSYNGVDVGQLDYRGAYRPQSSAMDIGAVEGAAGGVLNPAAGTSDSGGSTGGTDSGSTGGSTDGGSDGSSGGSTGGTDGGDSGSTGGSSSGGSVDIGSGFVPGDYVYLTADVMTELRARLQRGEAAAERFYNAVNAEVNGANQYVFPAWGVAMFYPLTGDQRYCDFAISEVDHYVSSEEQRIAGGSAPQVSFDSYLYVGEHIGEVALVHDWCKDFTTATQKQRWMAFANLTMENLWDHRNAQWGGVSASWTGWSVTNPLNNYYYSFLEATMLTGLAQRQTSPADAQRWMDQFRISKIENELIPSFTNFTGGGSPEGTSYGDAMRKLFVLYDWWEKSTGESIYDRTPHTLDSLRYATHAVTPTLDFVTFFGDHPREQSGIFFDYNRQYLLVASELYTDTVDAQLARDLVDKSSLPEMRYTFSYVWDFLYVDEAAPKQDIVNAPNYFYAEAAGHLFTRDSWETDSSYLTMSFGPRVESHDHSDKGSFSIFKNDWLAYTHNVNTPNGLNASVQFYNLVRFGSGGSIIEQPWTNWDDANSRPREGTRPTIQLVENTDDYSRVAMDIAPAYENSNVQTNWRELIYIRPGVTVVYDYVASTAGIPKTWQLNSPYSPSISGNVATFNGPSTSMQVTTLLPAGASGSVHNWQSSGPFQSNYRDSSGNFTPGSYRLDITSNSTSDTFLNVIDVEGAVETASVSSVNGEHVLSLKLVGQNMRTIRFSGCCTPSTIQ